LQSPHRDRCTLLQTSSLNCPLPQTHALQRARKAPMSVSGRSLPPSPAPISSLRTMFPTSPSGRSPVSRFAGSAVARCLKLVGAEAQIAHLLEPISGDEPGLRFPADPYRERSALYIHRVALRQRTLLQAEAAQFGSEMAAPVELRTPTGTGANSSTKCADESVAIRRLRSRERMRESSRLPLVGIRCLTETARTNLDLSGLLMEVADHPPPARSYPYQELHTL
jgi:hypothetical protein